MKTRALLALLCSFAMYSNLACADDSVTRVFKEPVTRVEVHNGAGSVHVHAASETVVKAERHGCDDAQNVQIRLQGSTLIATFEPGKGVRSCKVDFELAVPAQVAVLVEVGAGDVRISGTRGSVELESGSGDAVIDAEVHDLKVQVGSGDVAVRGLTRSARLEVGSGDVKLSYQTVPPKGSLEIDSGTGDIELRLPADARIRVDFQSGLGRLSSAIATTGGADFAVRARSGTGDMTIATH